MDHLHGNNYEDNCSGRKKNDFERGVGWVGGDGVGGGGLLRSERLSFGVPLYLTPSQQ